MSEAAWLPQFNLVNTVKHTQKHWIPSNILKNIGEYRQTYSETLVNTVKHTQKHL